MDKNTTVADAIGMVTLGDVGETFEDILIFGVIFIVISFIGMMFSEPRF